MLVKAWECDNCKNKFFLNGGISEIKFHVDNERDTVSGEYSRVYKELDLCLNCIPELFSYLHDSITMEVRDAIVKKIIQAGKRK